MLHKTDLKSFQRPGHLGADALRGVPQIIRDSMELVRRSETRYLWVDALCIVQNDETTRDCVSRMNEIYSGAHFTIIAAIRPSTRIFESHCDGKRFLSGDEPNVLRLHSTLLESAWAHRGWTFQEHLCSRRSLIFMDSVCFWECEGAVWCPGIPPKHATVPKLPIPHTFKAEKIHISREISRAPVSYSPIPDFSLYTELVCRYNIRSFTYEQDALVAFSGVLNQVARSFRGGFICGLPALFLDSALLWQPLGEARRRKATVRADEYGLSSPLPSWSWAGWKCRVSPQSLLSGKSYSQDLAECDLWDTQKLVDWSLASGDGGYQPIDEPAILQSCKDTNTKPNYVDLPPGWSRKSNSESSQPADTSTLPTWFVHASLSDAVYRYPLPEGENTATGILERNHATLSCITTKAELWVRTEPNHNELSSLARSTMITRYSMSTLTKVSMFDTPLYKFDCAPNETRSIVTLVDSQGARAGTLRIMNAETRPPPGVKLDMIAISTGSIPTRLEAARFSEKYHDRLKRWDDLMGFGQSGDASDTPPFTKTEKATGQLGDDKGSFRKSKAYQGCLRYLKSLNTCVFYNVLWVESINGIMYRKAAGRVKKDVWQQNCGSPQRIVLG